MAGGMNALKHIISTFSSYGTMKCSPSLNVSLSSFTPEAGFTFAGYQRDFQPQDGWFTKYTPMPKFVAWVIWLAISFHC